jgi:hypothetical protein
MHDFQGENHIIFTFSNYLLLTFRIGKVFVLLISIQLSNHRCAMKFLCAPLGVVARSRFQFENVEVASLYNSSLSERVIGTVLSFPL